MDGVSAQLDVFASLGALDKQHWSTEANRYVLERKIGMNILSHFYIV